MTTSRAKSGTKSGLRVNQRLFCLLTSQQQETQRTPASSPFDRRFPDSSPEKPVFGHKSRESDPRLERRRRQTLRGVRRLTEGSLEGTFLLHQQEISEEFVRSCCRRRSRHSVKFSGRRFCGREKEMPVILSLDLRLGYLIEGRTPI